MALVATPMAGTSYSSNLNDDRDSVGGFEVRPVTYLSKFDRRPGKILIVSVYKTEAVASVTVAGVGRCSPVLHQAGSVASGPERRERINGMEGGFVRGQESLELIS